jgi:glycopeptide antibiotics resistance protein
LNAALSTETRDRWARRWLFFLGVAAAALLVYASIVPLQFRPASLRWAVEQFRNLRWLHLDVYRRADWVANGLVAVPFGFLLAGACDADMRLTLRYALKLILVISFGCLLIVGIEFLQLWFPPRTVSGNDIVAGCIGAFVGPILWPLAGRPSLALFRRFRSGTADQWPPQRIARVTLGLYSAVLIAYSVMPLDVMFRAAEWRDKINAGRLSWIPDTAAIFGSEQGISLAGCLDYVTVLALSSVRFLPLGFLIYFARLGRSGLWLLIGTPILIELLQSAIFTRYSIFSDVLCGWIGGLGGMAIAARLPALLRWNNIYAVRLMLLTITVGAVLIAFLGRYEQLASSDEVAYGWSVFWSAPFAKYYYTSEFSAGSNAAGKFILFGAVGFLLANLSAKPGMRCKPPGKMTYIMALTSLLTLGFSIELTQIYLIPTLGDASDVLIYCFGGITGWAAYRTLATWRFQQLPRDYRASGRSGKPTLEGANHLST